MSCKIIDELMIANDYNQSAPDVLKHIATCDECNVLMGSIGDVESNLNKLYTAQEYPNVLTKRIMSDIPKMKRNNYIGYAACLMIIAIITFRHDIITFAKELPIIETLIEAFEREEEVQTVIDHDYPVVEDIEEYFITSLDGYRLYLKDVYVDDENIRMQLACSSPNGELIKDPVFEVASGRGVVKTYQNEEGNVWIPFESDTLSVPVNTDQMHLTVRLLTSEDKVWFEPFTININHTLEDQVFYYPINEYYNLDVGTIIINEVIVTPIDIKVVYEVDLSKNYHYFKWDNFVIEDSLGNVYDQYSYSGNFDHEMMVFEGTDYYDEPEWFKLKATGYTVNEVTMLPVEKAVDTPFVYKNHPFTFKVIDSDSEFDYDYGYVKTKVPTESSNYPIMLLWGYDRWLNLFDEDNGPVFKRCLLTKGTVNSLIGDTNDVDEHSLNIINNHIEESMGVKAKVDSLVEALSTLQEQESTMVELDLPKIDKMKLLIYREGDLQEMFGYINGMFKRSFELMLEIDVE